MSTNGKGGCCSSSLLSAQTTTATDDDGWGQPFTLAFGLQLEPPPPKTTAVVFATVFSKTYANDGFWKKECEDIPSDALFLMIDMGTVRDFFKPAHADVSMCDMLTSVNMHLFSPNGADWTSPAYYAGAHHNGGSSLNWCVS
jgi:hypothetical protein